MVTVLAVIHILIAIALILLVLIQDSKDGGAGGVFGGGGSNSVLSTSGANNLLVKLTRFFAFGFAGTCIALTIITTKRGGSVIDGYVPPPAAAVPAATPEKAATPSPTATPTQTDEKAKNTAQPQSDVDKK